MRLDFYIVVIDDELKDEDHKENVEELISFVKSKVYDKGFSPKVYSFSDVNDYEKEFPIKIRNRVDLLLSDNNLGIGKDGVEFYIDLAETGIYDFVLYTSDTQEVIVEKLISKLKDSGNPNLFSRFTFVNKDSHGVWLENISDIIDHMLTKREEINNFRGLYAQLISKVQNHLSKLTSLPLETEFKEVIKQAFHKKLFDNELKNFLNNQRLRRNGVIHNDEEFCNVRNEWFIVYTDKRGRTIPIYESDFSKYRMELKEVVERALNI